MSLSLLEIFHIRRGRLGAAGHSTYMLLHFLHCIYCTVPYCTVLYVTTWRGGLLFQKRLLHGSSITNGERTVATGLHGLPCFSTQQDHPTLWGNASTKTNTVRRRPRGRRKEKLALAPFQNTWHCGCGLWQAVMHSVPSVIRAARPAARAAAPLWKEVLIGVGRQGELLLGSRSSSSFLFQLPDLPGQLPGVGWCAGVALTRCGRRPSEEG